MSDVTLCHESNTAFLDVPEEDFKKLLDAGRIIIQSKNENHHYCIVTYTDTDRDDIRYE